MWLLMLGQVSAAGIGERACRTALRLCRSLPERPWPTSRRVSRLRRHARRWCPRSANSMNLIRRQCKPVRRWFPRSADRHTDVTFGRAGARVSSTPVWARCAVRQSSQPNDIESRTGEGAVMHCPFCRHPDSRVVDSREADEGQAIRQQALVPRVRPPFHHRRDRRAGRREAQRGH